MLSAIWKKWLSIARPIGNFQGQVILSIFYLIILFPLATIFRILADPFDLRKKSQSNFKKWEHPEETLEEARRQY